MAGKGENAGQESPPGAQRLRGANLIRSKTERQRVFRTVTAGRLLEAQGNLRSRQMVMSDHNRYQNPAYRPVCFFIKF